MFNWVVLWKLLISVTKIIRKDVRVSAESEFCRGAEVVCATRIRLGHDRDRFLYKTVKYMRKKTEKKTKNEKAVKSGENQSKKG